MKRKLLFAFLMVVSLGYISNAFAGAITATVTADNYYVLAYGNEDGSVLNQIGSSLTVDWNTPETYTFDAGEDDYIYVAVWGDGAVAQGFLGQFVTESGTIVTHPIMWEACSNGKPFAPESYAADIAAAEWSPVNYSIGQGAGIWPVLTAISINARWIWPTPLSPGSSAGDYHLMRTKAVYAPMVEITADAGEDISGTLDELASIVIQGQVTYTGGDPLEYRWVYGNFIFLDWTPVGVDNTCPLAYGGQPIPPGIYPLTLEVTDGLFTASDTMILTILELTPLVADAGEDVSVFAGSEPVTINGSAIYDGYGALQYRWLVDGNVLFDWMGVGENNSCPIGFSPEAIPTGSYEMTLEVTDGVFTAADTMILTIKAAPPIVADAGENITIYSDSVTGFIYGSATYAGDYPLQYRWLYDGAVLLDWTPVAPGNICPYSSGNNSIPVGTYTLLLEVTDGITMASDTMILTIMNSAPHAAVLEGPGTYQIGSDVLLASEASDFDGDILTYVWREGIIELSSGSIQAVAGGDPVSLPDCVISGLSVGSHYLTLEVADGINDAVIIGVDVVVIDSEAPTIAPIVSNGILWPPNHQMVDITIQANAYDNSGLPVTLDVSIASNEPEDGLGDGDMFPDWDGLTINEESGVINLVLRSERSGTGDGRAYTIIITATDGSGNASSVEKIVIVPHDKSKK